MSLESLSETYAKSKNFLLSATLSAACMFGVMTVDYNLKVYNAIKGNLEMGISAENTEKYFKHFLRERAGLLAEVYIPLTWPGRELAYTHYEKEKPKLYSSKDF